MNSKRLIGLILLILAILLIGGTLDLWDSGDILSDFWPVAIIAIGIMQFINKSNTSGWFLLIVGSIFLVQSLDLLEGINLWDYIWPLILLAIALRMIIGRKRPVFNKDKSDKYDSADFDSFTKETGSSEASNPFVMFGGISRSYYIDDYKGGNITTLFGGSEIDLRGCKVNANKIYIDVNTLFGGCELYIPNNWNVKLSGFPIFGAKDVVGRPSNSPDAPTVHIRTVTAFGGLEIHYKEPVK